MLYVIESHKFPLQNQNQVVLEKFEYRPRRWFQPLRDPRLAVEQLSSQIQYDGGGALPSREVVRQCIEKLERGQRSQRGSSFHAIARRCRMRADDAALAGCAVSAAIARFYHRSIFGSMAPIPWMRRRAYDCLTRSGKIFHKPLQHCLGGGLVMTFRHALHPPSIAMRSNSASSTPALVPKRLWMVCRVTPLSAASDPIVSCRYPFASN